MDEEDDRVIAREEVQGALEDMKACKAPGLDKWHVECPTKGVGAVVGELMRLFDVCFSEGSVPVSWENVCDSKWSAAIGCDLQLFTLWR